MEKIIRTREELINLYNLNEDEQVYLLDIFEEIEQEVYKMLYNHL